MKYYFTRYLFNYPRVIVYMLQDTEYKLAGYLRWYGRTSDFRKVMKRRSLQMTTKVRLLLLFLWLLVIAIDIAVIFLTIIAVTTGSLLWGGLALLLVLLSPFVLAYGIVVPLGLGSVLIQKPREKAMIARAGKKLADHKGIRIAIVGSYGKTTAKELLLTVLGEGLNVRATPGNMNTPIGISRFIETLDGNEDVLLFEYGEERVGDVRGLAEMTKPEYAVITGINEAHLESFGTLDRTVATIFEVAAFVDPGKLYKNQESPLVAEAQQPGILFSSTGVDGWMVTNSKTSVEGTAFTLVKAETQISAQTGLIGLHTIGVTVAAIAIAERLAVQAHTIEAGLRKVVPFEHRMQPRAVHGAWVIDDTYNGNSEGVRVGLAFLKDSGAKRRLYVTPGLVEQGDKTESVHITIGERAAVSADVVVLMKNSVTDYIKTGLKNANFEGSLLEFDDPLEFYKNIDHFVVAGDVVLMQNDWTDNYH